MKFSADFVSFIPARKETRYVQSGEIIPNGRTAWSPAEIVLKIVPANEDSPSEMMNEQLLDLFESNTILLVEIG